MTSEPRPEVNRGNVARRRIPTQQRARHTVDAILQATQELAATHRFDEMNTRLIADRAGVSVGSLYQYFPTYEAILVSWYEKVSIVAAQQIRMTTLAVMNRPLAEAVRTSCTKLLEIYQEHWLPLIEMPRQVSIVKDSIRFTSLEIMNRENIRLYLGYHPEFDPATIEINTFIIETFINNAIERYILERPDFLDDATLVEKMYQFIHLLLDASRTDAPA
jgi:AcrR family transcriptional regulator